MRRGRAAAAVVVLPLALVAGGGTALADPLTPAARAAAALGAQPGPVVVLLRVALLAGTAAVGGIALVHGLLGRRAPARAVAVRGMSGDAVPRGLQVTAWVAAGVVAAAAELAHLTGSVSVLGTLAHVVLGLVAAALLGTRWSAVPGALLLVLLAAQLGSAHTGLAFALDAAYAVAAGALVGATVVAVAGGDSRGGAATRAPEFRDSRVDAATRPSGFRDSRGNGCPRAGMLARVAITAGVVVVAAGAVQIVVSGPDTAYDLTGSGYGLAGLAAVVLPALGVLAWGAAALPAGRLRARELHRMAGVAGVTGLAAAALLAALPPAGPAPEPGRPLLRTIDAGGQRLALLVAPMRPGPNLVRLSGTGYPAPEAGPAIQPVALATGGHDHHPTLTTGASVATSSTSAVPFTTRDGAAGGWAVVDLPAGASTLTVSAGGVTSSVPVDTGADGSPVDAGATGSASAPGRSALTGADGPECAAALLGDLVGQRPGDPAPEAGTGAGGCPSDALSEVDAGALRATVRTLSDHGVRRVRLVSDDSPRARAAEELVRTRVTEAGGRLVDRPDADSALIVVSGWARAAATLREVSARALETPTHLGGTYLAPWLLVGGVVTRTSSSVVPLAFTPQDQQAMRYAAGLAAAFPGEPPSASGFVRWATHGGVTLDPRPTLFGAAPVNVPMTVDVPGEADGHHHGGGNPAAWFPNGTVVPVSAPLDPS